MTGNGHELQAHCAPCKVLYCWRGSIVTPRTTSSAACPRCKAPLGRKPRRMDYKIEQRTPVMLEVCNG